MRYISRAVEEYVAQVARSFRAVLVTGARQVGKSTLLAKLYPSHAVVTFDDMVLRAQAQEDPTLFLMNHPAPVLFDEVQYVPELFPSIKIDCDRHDGRGRFLLTGSQPLRLMERVSESMAGRVGIIELCGLSLREIQGVRFGRHFVPSADYVEARRATVVRPDDVWAVIHRGFYPELQNSFVPWQTFYASYVQTYLERDVSQVVHVRDRSRFVTFLQAMAARTGQMLNYDSVADEVGVSASTIRDWTSVLEASGIVLILQPFSNSALARAIKTPKLYFRDTGLACYLTRWETPETVRSGAMAGALFETFVVGEVVKSYANEGLDYRFHLTYYRGRDRLRRGGSSVESEIDLVISENGVNYPVEVKVTASPKEGMAAAFDVLDKAVDAKRGPGAIVCLYPDAFYLRRDLFVCPPWWL